MFAQAKEYMRFNSFFNADHLHPTKDNVADDNVADQDADSSKPENVSDKDAGSSKPDSVSDKDADSSKPESASANGAGSDATAQVASNTPLPKTGNIVVNTTNDTLASPSASIDQQHGQRSPAAASASDGLLMSESKTSTYVRPPKTSRALIQPRMSLGNKTMNFRRAFLTREGVKLFNLQVNTYFTHACQRRVCSRAWSLVRDCMAIIHYRAQKLVCSIFSTKISISTPRVTWRSFC